MEYKFIEINADIGDNAGSIGNEIIKILNKEAADGWKPFYPFALPLLFFSREKN